MEEHLFKKWLTPWEAQIVLVGGNILLIKIKCSAAQYLEIMIFRCLKTLVFDKSFKNSNIIWCFYFWRVLLVITNSPLYDYLTLFPHISLPPPPPAVIFSGKLTWSQNILEVSSDSPPPWWWNVQGEGDDAMDANLLDEYNILTDQGGLQLVLFTDTFKFLWAFWFILQI